MKWLLLRGLVREQRHWGEFPQLFSEVTGDPTLCLDLPGTGTEYARQGPASVGAIVEDLRARFGERSDGPWGILAVSLGGMVTLEWCRRYPDDFARAVVVNTSASNVGHPLERFGPEGVKTALGALRAKERVEKERRVIDLTCNRNDLDRAALAQEWAEFAWQRPISPTTALAQLLAASRFKAPERIDTALLILASHGDRLVNPKCSWTLATRLGVPIAVHPEAGHDLPRDAGPWVAEQVALWSKLTSVRCCSSEDSQVQHVVQSD